MLNVVEANVEGIYWTNGNPDCSEVENPSPRCSPCCNLRSWLMMPISGNTESCMQLFRTKIFAGRHSLDTFLTYYITFSFFLTFPSKVSVPCSVPPSFCTNIIVPYKEFDFLKTLRPRKFAQKFALPFFIVLVIWWMLIFLSIPSVQNQVEFENCKKF